LNAAARVGGDTADNAATGLPHMNDIPDHLPIPAADPKPWYRSRTIVAALAVVVTQAAALFGLALDVGALTELALNLIAVVGGAAAIYGRARAEQPIAAVLPRRPSAEAPTEWE